MADTTRPTGLMDPDFKYVKASDTDLHKTFARIKRQLKEQQAAQKPAPSTVRPLKKASA